MGFKRFFIKQFPRNMSPVNCSHKQNLLYIKPSRQRNPLKLPLVTFVKGMVEGRGNREKAGK